MLWQPRIYTGEVALGTDVRPADTIGSTITPAVGSKGSFSSLQTLTADAFGLTVRIHTNATSAASRETVCDIGIDPTGGTSYTVVIPNLLCGNASLYATSVGQGLEYYFPILMKSGTQIAARAQGSVTTTFEVFSMANVQNASIVPGGFITSVDAIGLGTLPAGTAVTPGGASEGSWTSLGTTARALHWWQLGVVVAASDTTHTNNTLHADLAWGDASNKRLIFQHLRIATATTEQVTNRVNVHEGWTAVPSGATIYARLQNSGANDTYQVTAYGGA